jgi:hypothetical protein
MGGGTGGMGGGTGGMGGGNGGSTWTGFTIELTIDEGLVGQILQVGFVNTASDFEGSSVFYDNVVVELGDGVGDPELVFEEDFESLDSNSPTALSATDWLRFLAVFDGTVEPPGFKFQDGPVPAPNATASPQDTFISAVVTGEGGTEQGAQQLSVFSEYNCCDLGQMVEQGHGNGTDLVETTVFQEPYNQGNLISGDEVGKTLTFSFQAKRGNIEGATTAFAFIKTLNPAAGFEVTNNITEDMTNLP